MPRSTATLLDHAAHPRNGGELVGANRVGHASLAGGSPRVTLLLRVEGDIVEDARFPAFGCAVTVAACSMLTLQVVGQPVAKCRTITVAEVIDSLGGIPPDKQFCARLVVEALQEALDQC